MATISNAFKALTNALDREGISYTTDRSGISLSRYVEVGPSHDWITFFKIRVSNHELPARYEQPDYDCVDTPHEMWGSWRGAFVAACRHGQHLIQNKKNIYYLTEAGYDVDAINEGIWAAVIVKHLKDFEIIEERKQSRGTRLRIEAQFPRLGGRTGDSYIAYEGMVGELAAQQQRDFEKARAAAREAALPPAEAAKVVVAYTLGIAYNGTMLGEGTCTSRVARRVLAALPPEEVAALIAAATPPQSFEAAHAAFAHAAAHPFERRHAPARWCSQLLKALGLVGHGGEAYPGAYCRSATPACRFFRP